MEIADLPSWARTLTKAARSAGDDVETDIALAVEYGRRLPQPGRGATRLRWEILAAVAAQDLTAGRVLEAHSDALAILHEAGMPAPDGSWGVFAAEAPGARVDVVSDEGEEVRLVGTQPWCSLAGFLDHALVSAYFGDERGLFAVDLDQSSVAVDHSSAWIARGLRNVTSCPVHFQATPARPVGVPGWYLSRPGFAWGGMGVAACWYGGMSAVAATVQRACAKRVGELSAAYIGSVDVALHGARVTLFDAARLVDAGEASGLRGEILALRVRAVVANAVEKILTLSSHALGPAPMAFDELHARRVADLDLYVRQHHAERDLAALGEALSRDVTAGTERGL